MNEKITIITPTYNRAYTLINCYESLVNQTNNNFIWLIIDDGSTDNTEAVVNNWQLEKQIKIEYYRKSNGGKASALNYAFEKIKTDYWVCLDSDDIFANTATEIGLKQLELIKNDNKYCGLIALSSKKNGEPFGDKVIPKHVDDTTVLELSEKYGLRTEYTQFYKTDITNSYRFPEIDGEKFISPEYLAHELSKKYRFKVDHNIFCYCEYLPDGLTKNKLDIIMKNPKGYTLVIKQGFELTENFWGKSKRCLKYISGSILSGDRSLVSNSPHKLMTIIYYPAGWLVYKLRFGKRIAK